MPDELTIHGATETHEQISAQIQFHVPDDMLSRYASNFVVQRQEHEVVLSFFEVIGPIILTPDVPPPTVVRASCVARITVARSRLQELATILQKMAETIHAEESASREK